MINEAKRLQQLAGIITENELHPGGFVNSFDKNDKIWDSLEIGGGETNRNGLWIFFINPHTGSIASRKKDRGQAVLKYVSPRTGEDKNDFWVLRDDIERVAQNKQNFVTDDSNLIHAMDPKHAKVILNKINKNI